ncbi:MAG: cytochrome c [Actinomycetota bacterium]|nr:cytochrome c [Actinomycetota bacterium]MDQ5808912.1 cytochrome c [Actinomycetota bacterium]
MTRRRLKLLVLPALAALVFGACGKESIELNAGEDDRIRDGALIFNDKCSGCHTLGVAGTQGSAVNVRDRERTDGPNFNTRPESVDAVLYAIRNGGFSGAIMPENIVVGDDARKVAEFLAKYAGGSAGKPVAPQSGGETP